MSLTRTEARDEIYAMLKAAWDTTGVQLLYADVEGNAQPTQQASKVEPKPWARASVNHDTRFNSSLGNAMGQRRYQADGRLVVQIFTPLGEGLSSADSYAILLQDTFDSKSSPSGVEFAAVKAEEIGPDGPWFQTNVTIDFSYDEVK